MQPDPRTSNREFRQKHPQLTGERFACIAVEVESYVDKGTIFRVDLPLNVDEMEAKAEQYEPGSKGADETILLIDDEDSVRTTTGEVLTMMGYHVIEACNGEEALDIFKAERHKIDLIISDVIMPRMGGEALLKAVRQLDEKMPVILVTGYDKAHVLEGVRAQDYLVLNKPFDFDSLSRSIQTLLKLV